MAKVPGRLFVGNLERTVTDADLKDVFSKYGKLKDAEVMLSRETGNSRGFGFITFEDPVDAENAVKNHNGQVINGRAVRLDYAMKRRDDEDDFPNRGRDRDRGGRGRRSRSRSRGRGRRSRSPPFRGGGNRSFGRRNSPDFDIDRNGAGFRGGFDDSFKRMNGGGGGRGGPPPPLSGYMTSKGAAGPPGLGHNSMMNPLSGLSQLAAAVGGGNQGATQQLLTLMMSAMSGGAGMGPSMANQTMNPGMLGGPGGAGIMNANLAANNGGLGAGALQQMLQSMMAGGVTNPGVLGSNNVGSANSTNAANLMSMLAQQQQNGQGLGYNNAAPNNPNAVNGSMLNNIFSMMNGGGVGSGGPNQPGAMGSAQGSGPSNNPNAAAFNSMFGSGGGQPNPSNMGQYSTNLGALGAPPGSNFPQTPGRGGPPGSSDPTSAVLNSAGGGGPGTNGGPSGTNALAAYMGYGGGLESVENEYDFSFRRTDLGGIAPSKRDSFMGSGDNRRYLTSSPADRRAGRR